uniref:Uncharacterized protein n=1 Tax=Anguilla anguilla TaxID=7936 RepID=A0A0E9PE21_ANGAN
MSIINRYVLGKLRNYTSKKKEWNEETLVSIQDWITGLRVLYLNASSPN